MTRSPRPRKQSTDFDRALVHAATDWVILLAIAAVIVIACNATFLNVTIDGYGIAR